MLFREEDYKFMFAALTEAEKALAIEEVPIGAVVVHNNRIIGRGHNQTELLNDATAHAEMLALTAASNHLKSKQLTDCDIYVTIEPCLMCAGAIQLARINTLYFGALEPKFGACGSLYNVIEGAKYNHKVEVFSGIYENEASNLMREFFERQRQKKFKYN